MTTAVQATSLLAWELVFLAHENPVMVAMAGLV
jgi:hypothetical protein